MTVLHSKDLVNWKICGHAVEDLTQISPELSWQRMNRYSRGVFGLVQFVTIGIGFISFLELLMKAFL